MTRTIVTTKTVYKWDELSDKAKERARNDHEQIFGFSGASEAKASLEALAKHFGGTLADYSMDWNGTTHSWASFNMPEMEQADIESGLASLGSYDPQTLCGHGECNLTGVCYDESAIDGFRKAWHSGERNLNKLMQSAFQSWLKDCQSEHQADYNDPEFGETCDANNYEFDVNGKLSSVAADDQLDLARPFTSDDDTGPVMATEYLVESACLRIKGEALEQQHDMVEGLWNWIDYLPIERAGDEPIQHPDLDRKCWNILAKHFPSLFNDPTQTNSFKWKGAPPARIVIAGQGEASPEPHADGNG